MKLYASPALSCLIIILGLISPQVQANSLQQLINADHRSAKNIARNQYRHPAETLAFFQLQPDMTIVEIWPGGGWYTEVLAPYVKDQGQYYAAHFSEHQSLPFFQKMRARFTAKMQENKNVYGPVKIAGLHPPSGDRLPAPAESADRVFTFRNVHNWSKGGYDQAMFDSFFKMLKPGGILGVVEHRAKPDTDFKTMIESGYMTEEYVINVATKSGFKLLAKSEVNANPADLKDYPNGVWSLPPTLRGKDKRRMEYVAIGESDRMTLSFIKPTGK